MKPEIKDICGKLIDDETKRYLREQEDWIVGPVRN
jgi:hypothetical protein